ncbi:MAG: hypothetical protein LBT12_06555, partial [Oscillospiraceae bacterium]|nr:hypothetical protein [Oscillospiraceae bacterium]
MKIKTKTSQRLLAALLAVITVLGMIPALTIDASAAADPSTTNLSNASTTKILYNTASGHTDGTLPLEYLTKQDGGTLSSYLWRYEADNGLESR